MDNLSYFISLFPDALNKAFSNLDFGIKGKINEIRLRRGKPIIIYVSDKPYFIEYAARLSDKLNDGCMKISENDFDYICDRLCNNSYHTNMSSLIDGYVTVKNGSRVGVASTAVIKNGEIHSVKDISSLNIRISHEYKNCALEIMDYVCLAGLKSIIVAGKPASGKTTFLRDYARQISSGYFPSGKKVAIVDERRELAGNFDVGINTDVLTGFPKAKGIEMAVRTLSPELIICDEIGNINELEAIKNGFSSGVSFAVSVHIRDDAQIFSNKIVTSLVGTMQFDYIVLLKSYTREFEIIELGELKGEGNRTDNDNPFFITTWLDGG